MTKRTRRFVVLGVAGAALVALFALVAVVYSASDLKLPGAFAGPARFAAPDAVLFLEFPSLARGLDALKKTPAGARLVGSALTRELVSERLEDLVRAAARRLQRATGLEVGDAELLALFARPAALVLYPDGKSNVRALAAVTVSPGDRFLVNLAAKLGALGPKNAEARRQVWRGVSIYALGDGARAVWFCLANDVLLASDSLERLQDSLAHAVQPKGSAPRWAEFLREAPVGTSTFFRLWARPAWAAAELPLVALVAADAAAAEAVFLTGAVGTRGLELAGGWYAAPTTSMPAAAPAIDAALKRIPEDAQLAVADGKAGAARLTRADGPLGALLENANGNLAGALVKLGAQLQGEQALVFHGLRQKGDKSFVSASLSVVFPSAKKAAVAAAWNALLSELPGLKPVAAGHLGTAYTRLAGGDDDAFDPCFAFLDAGGETSLVLGADETAMRAAIELAKGGRRAALDGAAAQALLRRLGGRPGFYARVDLADAVKNLAARLGDFAFKAGSGFSRQDVLAVFKPILDGGLPFQRATVVGARAAGQLTRIAVTLE